VSDVITLAVWVRSDLELNIFWVLGVDHLRQICLMSSQVNLQACMQADLSYLDVPCIKLGADFDSHPAKLLVNTPAKQTGQAKPTANCMRPRSMPPAPPRRRHNHATSKTHECSRYESRFSKIRDRHADLPCGTLHTES